MLKPIPLHILLTLADGDSHGYGIMQSIRARTNGSVAVQTASFYRHLGQLIDEAWVAEAPGRREGDDPRRGTYYRITARGRQVLAEEKRRLTDLVAQMKKIPLGPRKAGV
jgi:DNA-binding PadR family transcriptional regulator